MLRKRKASNPDGLRHLSPDLLDAPLPQTIHNPHLIAKELGIEWSPRLDDFHLSISEFPRLEVITKRALVFDVARTFNIIGWFAPAVVKVKILLRRLWESGVGWDDLQL